MNHGFTDPGADEHGPNLPLARSEVGQVSICSCGALTVTLHCMSLRFEPAAFRELLGMLNQAQARLDDEPVAFPHPAPPVH